MIRLQQSGAIPADCDWEHDDDVVIQRLVKWKQARDAAKQAKRRPAAVAPSK